MESANTKEQVRRHSSYCKLCEIRATDSETDSPLPFSLRHLLAKRRSVERFEEFKCT